MSDTKQKDFLILTERIKHEPVLSLNTEEWTEEDWLRLEEALEAAYRRRMAILN